MFNQQLSRFPQSVSFLPGAFAILKQAWVIYRKRLGLFLKVMAIPLSLMIIFSVVFPGGKSLINSLLSSEFASGSMELPVILTVFLLTVFVFIFFFASQIWGQTALLYAIKDWQEGIGLRESYRRGWHKMISYWWISFLVAFITFGGFFLFIIPGVIFTVWFSLTSFVLIAENIKGTNALLKSREYVKGRWWSVFWRIFFISIIPLFFSLLFFILGFSEIPFSKEIGYFITGLFLTPLVMTYYFLLYNNLKTLKGEFVFKPAKSKKAVFIFPAILGFSVIPIIFSLIVVLSFISANKKAFEAFQQIFSRTPLQESLIENEIAYWQTYKNEKYGFEIKYPTGWTIEEKIEENKEPIKEHYRWDILSPWGNIGYGSIAMDYFVCEDNEKFFDKEFHLLMTQLVPRFGLTVEEITIDGVEGFRGTGYQQEADEAESMHISQLFPDKENRGTFIISAGSKDLKNKIYYQRRVNLILSTFKFLD